MSDVASGRGGAPMWAADPRQQVPGEGARDTGRSDTAQGRSASDPDAASTGGAAGHAGDWEQFEAAEGVEPGPGALLAAERSAQGLGVGDIARQLKLSVRQVEALERDDYGAFAGMVFVRGFLRNYAKLLDRDPEPLVAMTHPAGAGQQPAATAPEAVEALAAGRPARPLRGWLLGAAVLAVLVVAAIFEGRQRELPRRELRPMPDMAPSPVRQAEAPTETQPAPAASARGSAANAEQGVTAAPAQLAPGAAAATSEPAESPAQVPASLEAAAPLSEKRLRLQFDGASWVEVKDAHGAIIFSQLNDAGSERVVHGRPPLSVVIGNAHGVRLSYGDRPVDLSPHTKVDVARLVLE